MKIAIIGAVLAATVLSALPASAQIVVRPDRDGVRVQERHRGFEQARYRRHNECRTVRTRTVTPGGRVIIKTRRSC